MHIRNAASIAGAVKPTAQTDQGAQQDANGRGQKIDARLILDSDTRELTVADEKRPQLATFATIPYDAMTSVTYSRSKHPRWKMGTPAAHADSLLVTMADKLHNSSAILRDFQHHGPDLFCRFNAGPGGYGVVLTVAGRGV